MRKQVSDLTKIRKYLIVGNLLPAFIILGAPFIIFIPVFIKFPMSYWKKIIMMIFESL